MLLMGKATTSTGPFSIAMLVYQRVLQPIQQLPYFFRVQHPCNQSTNFLSRVNGTESSCTMVLSWAAQRSSRLLNSLQVSQFYDQGLQYVDFCFIVFLCACFWYPLHIRTVSIPLAAGINPNYAERHLADVGMFLHRSHESRSEECRPVRGEQMKDLPIKNIWRVTIFFYVWRGTNVCVFQFWFLKICNQNTSLIQIIPFIQF